MYSGVLRYSSVKWSVTFNTGSALFLSLFFCFWFLWIGLAQKIQTHRQKKIDQMKRATVWYLSPIGSLVMCLCEGAVPFVCVFPLNWAYQLQRINAHFVCSDWNTHQNVIYSSALRVCTHFLRTLSITSKRMYISIVPNTFDTCIFSSVGAKPPSIKHNWCQFTFIGRKGGHWQFQQILGSTI